MLCCVGIQTKIVKLLLIALLEGIQSRFLEEWGHGEGHFAVEDGTDIMGKFIGLMIDLK